jgi:putative hydrolase of the HAD superfamily
MLNKRYNYKKDYQYILFDLDRTIWDFEANSIDNIEYILDQMGLINIDKSLFCNVYKKHNKDLWIKYEQGGVDKETLRWKRFFDTFEEFGIFDTNLAKEFGDYYINNMPNMTKLMPNARDVLETLYHYGCKMAIVTNGFKEVQYKKLKNASLDHYFRSVIISEEIGHHKPSPMVFKTAINSLKAKKDNTLMVGDDAYNDIEGAMIYGIDQFYYYKNQDIRYKVGATYESDELKDILTLFPL